MNLILERRFSLNDTDEGNKTAELVTLFQQLEAMLLNGSLLLTDFNNNTIPVPPQKLQRNVEIGDGADFILLTGIP